MEDDLYGGLEVDGVQGALDALLYDGIFAESASSGHHETYLQHKVNELEESLRGSLGEIKSLQAQLQDRNLQLAKMTFERDTLLRNISCLYNTAKEEMARKQNEINSLRTEVAQAKLQHPLLQPIERIRCQPPTTTLEWKPARKSPPPFALRPPAPPAARQLGHARHSLAPNSVSDAMVNNHTCYVTSQKRLREGGTDLEDGEVGRGSSRGRSREPDEVSDAKRPRHGDDTPGPPDHSASSKPGRELDAVAGEAPRKRVEDGHHLRPGEEMRIRSSSLRAPGRSTCRDGYKAPVAVAERQDGRSHSQAGLRDDACDHAEARGTAHRDGDAAHPGGLRGQERDAERSVSGLGGPNDEPEPAARERQKVHDADFPRSKRRAEHRAAGEARETPGEPRAISTERGIRVTSTDQAWLEHSGQCSEYPSEAQGEERPVSGGRATDVHHPGRRQVSSDRDACARGLRDRSCTTGREHDKDETRHTNHRLQGRSSRHASVPKDLCDENQSAGSVRERHDTHRADYRQRERSDRRALDLGRQHIQSWASGDGSSHHQQVEHYTPERKVLRDENRVVVSDRNMYHKRLLESRLPEANMQGREREGRDKCQNGQNCDSRQWTSTDGDRKEGRPDGSSGRNNRDHGRGAI